MPPSFSFSRASEARFSPIWRMAGDGERLTKSDPVFGGTYWDLNKSSSFFSCFDGGVPASKAEFVATYRRRSGISISSAVGKYVGVTDSFLRWVRSSWEYFWEGSMSSSSSSLDCSRSSYLKGTELSESLWWVSPVSSCGTTSPISNGISNFDSCASDMILWSFDDLGRFRLASKIHSGCLWRNLLKSHRYSEGNKALCPAPPSTPSTEDEDLRDFSENGDRSPVTIENNSA